MEIALAEERVLVLDAQLSLDQAEGRAWSQKMDAFGRLVKVTGILQKIKDEDFSLTYKEHRFQPFWRIECKTRYVYQRRRKFTIPVGGPEVRTVTLEGMEYQVEDGSLTMSGVEHCREELHKDVLIDGLTNQMDPNLSQYLDFPAREIPQENLETLGAHGTIVVPPQGRASAIVREVLIGMIKSVQADRILEDVVEVQRVDLYYRPVYAFQYHWHSKDREAVMEFDGLTGRLQPSGKTFQEYMGKILEPDFLFDVGIDTVDLLVPGGGIAIKLVKKGLDAARKKEGS